MDDLGDLALPATYFTFYASSWLVTHTALPERWRGHVSIALVVVGFVAVSIGAKALGVDLTPARCAAETSDGSRCTRDAEGPLADLCWQHRDLHDVTLHPSAADGVVDADAAERDLP